MQSADQVSAVGKEGWFRLSRTLKMVVYGGMTCIFALGGAVVGSVTGAIKGQTTETGPLCGAGIGAVAGAVVSVELMESLIQGNVLSQVIVLKAEVTIWYLNLICLTRAATTRECLHKPLRSCLNSMSSSSQRPVTEVEKQSPVLSVCRISEMGRKEEDYPHVRMHFTSPALTCGFGGMPLAPSQGIEPCTIGGLVPVAVRPTILVPSRCLDLDFFSRIARSKVIN